MGPHYLKPAGGLLNKPLSLAHSMNCCPLPIQSSGPPVAACNHVTSHLQTLRRANFILDNELKLAHQAHNDTIQGCRMGLHSLKSAG